MAACPTPDKAAYPQPGAAYAALDRLKKRSRRTGATTPVKVYACDCGCWHMAGAFAEVPRRDRSRKRDKKNSHRRSGRRRA